MPAMLSLFAAALRPRAAIDPGSGGWSGVTFSGLGSPAATFAQATRAYLGNEIINAGVNLLATSAAEPHITGRRYRRNRPQVRNEARYLAAMGVPNRAGTRAIDSYLVRNGFYEEVPDHPLVKLLNNPNPYISRGQFWSGLVVDYMLAGNAYVLKARTARGNLVAELWPVRPDQMRPIPGDMAAGEPFIVAYERTRGAERQIIPASDVLHFKTPNPQNPYEGISPILPLLPRARIDENMRNFLSTFFERGGAGVGASLNVKGGRMDQEAKDDLRERFRRMFSGGQYDVLVSNAEDVTYTPFALNRGLRDALPKEIDAVTEARMAMVLGIPGSILGLLIGYETSSYANQRQAWQVLWDVKMTPLLSDFDDVLSLGLLTEPGFVGIDEIFFDLSDIKALQEDEEALQERARKNVAARIWTMEEAREKTGIGDLNPDEHFLLPDGTAVKVADLDEPPEAPEPPEPDEDEDEGEDMPMPMASHRPGRLRLENDPAAVVDYKAALDFRARYPGLTWAQIAGRIGRSERQLRELRARLDDADDE